MPAFTYKIEPNTADSHQVNPFWFAAFSRFKHRDSFTRDGLTEEKKLTSSISEDCMEEIDDTLIAHNDITQWSTTSSKETHLTTLQMQIVNKDINYVAEVCPGDWVCFWTFDNKNKYKKTLEKVKLKDRVNQFEDGFKFVGRVVDVRRSRRRSATGIVTVSYSITASGFTELDAQIYYHPLLLQVYQGSQVKIWSEFGGSKNPTVFDLPQEVGGLVSGQNVIIRLLQICLGLGPANTGQQNLLAVDPEKLAGQLLSPNRAMRVPKTIIKWLTANNTAVKDVWTYADMFKPYVGIQDFSGAKSEDKWSGFVPEKKADLNSSFNQLPTLFNGNSVWSLLSAFINDPVDEVFTCMRVDEKGFIMPSLMARQTTLTSNPFYNNFSSKIKSTPFMSVPRWKIDESLIMDIDFGRSDALRFNWVRLHGQDLFAGNANLSANTVQDTFIPPKLDDKDIERSGLRWYNKVINANVNNVDTVNGHGNEWQALVADFLMGGHLRFQGQIICKGIVEPICIGDNLEVEDIVFHIESITHSGSINPMGIKDFNTTIKLSNGVSVLNDDDSQSRIDPKGGEIVYPDLQNLANPDQQKAKTRKILHGADAQTIEEEFEE